MTRLPSPRCSSRAFDARLTAIVALLFGTHCGARTALELDAVVDTSTQVKPKCTPGGGVCIVSQGACETPTRVAAACDEASGTWSCPSGTRPYARAPAATAACLPFRHAQGIDSIGAWGVAGLARIPIDDHRCLWLLNQVTLSGGKRASNVALEPDQEAPFGACPEESLIPPTPIVSLEGGDDATILVAINGAYRLRGVTRVLYRLFRVDSNAAFGLSELGSGLAHYDPQRQQIVVPNPAKPLPWGLDLDLGDASIASAEGVFGFAWGCTARESWDAGCFLARLDVNDSIQLFSGGDWITGNDPTRATTVFSSGTWVSSVVRSAGALRHVYISAFGSHLLTQSAAKETGPWTDSAQLAVCRLPSNDANAFCAGPIVHPEISDPTRPRELAISYQVGTQGASTGSLDDYWPRLVWVEAP